MEYDTYFPDTYNSKKRIGLFYAKKIAQNKLHPTIKKVAWTVILFLIAMYVLTLIANAWVDTSIKAVQSRNLAIYHDVNGFQPVH